MIEINENFPDWKAQLVRDHPLCIFCGGTRPSAEPDHQPARTFFRERRGPEGYSFPACVACNRQTRGEEVFASLLASIRRSDDTRDSTDPIAGEEITRKLQGVERNSPGILARMIPTSNQIRRATRLLGVTKQPGQSWRDLWRQTKVVRIDRPEFHDAIRSVARKLLFALHWKHTDGRIVQRGGGALIRYFSNFDIQAGQFPIPNLIRAIELCAPAPMIARAGKDLRDQFFYRTTEEPMSPGVYIIFFPESFVIAGEVFEMEADVPAELARDLLGPIDHQRADQST